MDEREQLRAILELHHLEPDAVADPVAAVKESLAAIHGAWGLDVDAKNDMHSELLALSGSGNKYALGRLARGLAILCQYADPESPAEGECSARHDLIFASAYSTTSERMRETAEGRRHLEELEELGWADYGDPVDAWYHWL